jgi:methylglutaconyl-CoA hydratase
MDLAELHSAGKQTLARNFEDSRRLAKLFYRLYSFPKPVIAAVNGPALGGGCGIATLADFTLSASEATFGYPEVNVGFIPAIVSVFLRRQIGEKRTRELLLSGKIIGAAEAFRLGLVTEIVSSEALMVRAREIAGTLLAASATALARTKKLLIDYEKVSIRADLETAIEANAEVRSRADFREGIAAFIEKRAPKWSQE